MQKKGYKIKYSLIIIYIVRLLFILYFTSTENPKYFEILEKPMKNVH